ncbi:nucleoside-diphosphate sugar epimerase [Thermococci archaeon]|nr:MAG: nucleoside-diphosphate sugar epimerase [Thermococci archaeon]
MSVIVTGGAGFILSRVATSLAKEGYDVIVLDNLSTGDRNNLPEDIPLLRVDLSNYGELPRVKEVLKDASLVVHGAALTSASESMCFPAEYLRNNVLATANIAEASVSGSVDKIVFASSASVYGNQDPPLREDMPPKPENPYALSKLIGELILEEYSDKYGIETVSLRIFNVYGPGQKRGVLHEFLSSISRGIPPKIYGGSQTRDFIHVEDVSRAFLLSIEKRTRSRRINIGTGKETSIVELYRILSEEASSFGLEMEKPEMRRAQPNEIERSFADTSLAKKELGFEAEISLRDGIREMIDLVLRSSRRGI